MTQTLNFIIFLFDSELKTIFESLEINWNTGIILILNFFIVFYVVIGTLSHAKIILELLLQNDKAKAFSEGGDHPLNPPPPKGRPPRPPPL